MSEHMPLPGVAPIAISFMLTCYVTPMPEEHVGRAQWNSLSGGETLKWLRDNGLIDQDNKATERGEAWVKFICATPLPVSRWSLPERTK